MFRGRGVTEMTNDARENNTTIESSKMGGMNQELGTSDHTPAKCSRW